MIKIKNNKKENKERYIFCKKKLCNRNKIVEPNFNNIVEFYISSLAKHSFEYFVLLQQLKRKKLYNLPEFFCLCFSLHWNLKLHKKWQENETTWYKVIKYLFHTETAYMKQNNDVKRNKRNNKYEKNNDVNISIYRKNTCLKYLR